MAFQRGTVQAVIWSGTDIYDIISVLLPVIAHVSKRAYLHNQVIRQIQPRVIEEFGQGATVRQVDSTTYRIDVSEVHTQ